MIATHLTPFAQGVDVTALLGKSVIVQGVLPQSARGKVPATLRYKTIAVVQMTTSSLPMPAIKRVRQASLMNYLSLFGSFSTLVCCALPSLLVLMGMGATVASRARQSRRGW